MIIAVAGTGYVGLSLAVLLSQNNEVTAVDIIPEKVEKLNNYISPIQDEYIEKYLEESKNGKRKLNLTATTDAISAYSNADYVIIAAPTNYDPKKNFFDCSAVEAVISTVIDATKGREEKPTIVIKSTIPSGYTKSVKEKFGMCSFIFTIALLIEKFISSRKNVVKEMIIVVALITTFTTTAVIVLILVYGFAIAASLNKKTKFMVVPVLFAIALDIVAYFDDAFPEYKYFTKARK